MFFSIFIAEWTESCFCIMVKLLKCTIAFLSVFYKYKYEVICLMFCFFSFSFLFSSKYTMEWNRFTTVPWKLHSCALMIVALLHFFLAFWLLCDSGSCWLLSKFDFSMKPKDVVFLWSEISLLSLSGLKGNFTSVTESQRGRNSHYYIKT